MEKRDERKDAMRGAFEVLKRHPRASVEELYEHARVESPITIQWIEFRLSKQRHDALRALLKANVTKLEDGREVSRAVCFAAKVQGEDGKESQQFLFKDIDSLVYEEALAVDRILTDNVAACVNKQQAFRDYCRECHPDWPMFPGLY